MEKENNQTLTVGPITAALLNSLRAIETARSYYFDAWNAAGGEQAAEGALKAKGAVFDAAAEMIQGELAAEFHAWANSSPASNEI